MESSGESNLTRSTRESYDQIADEYTSHISDELRHKPFDSELLSKFALKVGRGEICDLGCGPGHVSTYLHELGANVFGLDLSPKMLEQASRLNPEIAFREGDMMGLDLPDEKLAGIVAFYAICNLPKDHLPMVFREMKRVLAPEGLLLLAFHAGDEIIHRDEMWGKPVSIDFFFYEPQLILRLLHEAGLSIEEQHERGPYASDVEYQSRRAYILARKSRH
jgi:SAM-dependent methyltransferase